MIFRKNGMWYCVYDNGRNHPGRVTPFVCMRYYYNVLTGENEPWDYYPDAFREHYLMQDDEGVIRDGKLLT